jgi:hypothetical protein
MSMRTFVLVRQHPADDQDLKDEISNPKRENGKKVIRYNRSVALFLNSEIKTCRDRG